MFCFRIIVSQFTLLAKTSKGNKPDFHLAAPGEDARRLYHYFLEKVKAGYVAERVKDGKFQAMMEVALVNDGPVSPPTHVLTLVPLDFLEDAKVPIPWFRRANQRTS